jgi:hypothetical protein
VISPPLAEPPLLAPPLAEALLELVLAPLRPELHASRRPPLPATAAPMPAARKRPRRDTPLEPGTWSVIA